MPADEANLLIQVKVDTLVSGHVPLKWKHNLARLSEVPAQDLRVLQTHTDTQLSLFHYQPYWMKWLNSLYSYLMKNDQICTEKKL